MVDQDQEAEVMPESEIPARAVDTSDDVPEPEVVESPEVEQVKSAQEERAEQESAEPEQKDLQEVIAVLRGNGSVGCMRVANGLEALHASRQEDENEENGDNGNTEEKV